MNFVRSQYTERILFRAQVEVQKGNFNLAWKLLEQAHILAQPTAGLHLYVHCEMLSLAFKSRNYQEIWGQILRLFLAVPSSIFRLYPVGNSGRSNVSMFLSSPLGKNLAGKIRELEILEKQRIKNGGIVKERIRQHPLSRG